MKTNIKMIVVEHPGEISTLTAESISHLIQGFLKNPENFAMIEQHIAEDVKKAESMKKIECLTNDEGR